MVMLVGVVVLAVLMQCMVLPQVNSEECQIYYISQPPPELPCNPYITATGIQMEVVLGCDVRGPFIESGSFDYSLQWMRISLEVDGAEAEKLNQGDSTSIFEIETVTLFNDASIMKSGKYSTLRIHLNELPLNTVLTGTYWCQAVLNASTGESTHSNLQPSLKTTILDPYVYRAMLPSVPPCLTNIPFSHSQLTCADHNSFIAPSTSKPTSMPPSQLEDHSTTMLPNSVLVVLAASGGIMLTVIIILVLIVICSCLHIKNITQQELNHGQQSVFDDHASIATTMTYATNDSSSVFVNRDMAIHTRVPVNAMELCDEGTDDECGDMERRRGNTVRKELTAEALEYVPGACAL